MKEFKKPDVKAPRFRPSVYNLLNKEFFESFRDKYPKYKDVTDDQLKNIIKVFNQIMWQNVIDNRDGVQIPEQIGWLFIGTCQASKKNNIDFAKSKQYGVTVTNKNWATDGKLAKIFFSNFAPKHKIRNREFWMFVACRDFKRAVAKAYPENWQMYIVADPKKQTRLIYSKSEYKELKRKEETKTLETYNEFEL
jgi:hypothetical protein